MNGLYDEFRIALNSVWQRRWLALAVAWGICLLGWAAVALVPNSYESQAKVFVQMQDVLADKIGITPQERSRQVDRIQQTLVSSINLEKVVRGTALGEGVESASEMEAKVAGLRRSIRIVSSKDNLFEITATGASPSVAQNVVQKLIDIFREENLGGRNEMSETLKFLDTQLAERQKELEGAEQRRVAFETKNAGLLPGVGSVGQRMESARLELSQIDGQLASAQSALAAINGQLAGTPSTIPGASGSAGGARGALSAARAELATAKARGWTDSHPDVVAMRNQIAALQTQAASEPSGSGGVPNPAYSSLQSIRAERQANVAALSARKAALQADITAMTGKLAEEPGVAAEAARISRDYEVLKQQYDKLLQDREEVKLRGQVETETDALTFEVIDPPSTPRSPAAPNRPLLLAIVLVAGICGGIGAAFALGQLRTSYPTVTKLQQASGLPVLGAISHTLTGEARAQRKKSLRYFAGASAALGAVFLCLLGLEFVQRGMVA